MVQGSQCGRIETDEPGGEGTAQAARAAGIEERVQECMEFEGFLGGEDVGAGVDHNGHRERLEGLGHGLSLNMSRDEHRTVPRRDSPDFARPVVAVGCAQYTVVEQVDDGRRHPGRQRGDAAGLR